MEEIRIKTQEKLCKGLIIKKEFIFELTEEQTKVIKEIAEVCDCSSSEVLDYLIEDNSRKLLLQFFKGDLNKAKEKLMELIFNGSIQ